ncbi:MAG: trypsin-like peptidase domain-containing protein [Thaumarchaeota archaeon]|nr:trypsin-like peptidase domain-containing protein [Nitrososphaerota archaeon]
MREFEPKTISEQLLFTTVRIDSENKDGSSSSGTSFIIQYEKDGNHYPFLVTNRHVVTGSDIGHLRFNKKNNSKAVLGDMEELVLHDFESLWHFHPDITMDVAVMPIGFVMGAFKAKNKEVFFKSVPNQMIPSKTDFEELDAIEEITTIGYPKRLRDEFNLMPIVRRGITATHPDIDFDNKPIFLIDAPIFAGASGSPVFIVNQGMIRKKTGGITMGGNRILLLGIVARAYSYFEKREIQEKEMANVQVSIDTQYMDLGVVFKSHVIVETIEHALQELAKK